MTSTASMLESDTASAQLNVVIGVGGGIAAYKSLQLIRLFKEAGHTVHVIPTENAYQFVGKASFEALSGNPVTSSAFDAVEHVNHVKLAQEADLMIVAPTTADLLSRFATGRADDLLTSTFLMTTAPVILAPAMHTEMWNHPATQENVAQLRERGTVVIDPANGRLAGKDSGPGRLPEAGQIYRLAMAQYHHPAKSAHYRDLSGQRILISGGGTQEAIDPVRYIGNHSSGKQAIAMAELAQLRGAEVTLVLGDYDQTIVPLVDVVIPVSDADHMYHVMLDAQNDADIIIMAAAVADYKPEKEIEHKIKKTSGNDSLTLTLAENPDILTQLVERRDSAYTQNNQTIVGFAAETGDNFKSALEYSYDKLQRKGVDLLVGNDVSQGKTFGQDKNTVWVLKKGESEPILEREASDKYDVSQAILDVLVPSSLN